ncbi:MAG TPA: transcription antitermination factor NusB [Syntrophomonadaceae bacterium]|nr:transcription antitermination factor NusB [Syntrophomonadaceae bacterium]
MSRRKAREVAFKVIYQIDQVQADPKDAFKYVVDEDRLLNKDKAFSWQLITGCIDNWNSIDEKITLYSTAWDLERMSSVDRNIMRIGAYELLFMDHSLAAIPIDEAIEIAKKYSGENSAGFVNAVLDKIKDDKNQYL